MVTINMPGAKVKNQYIAETMNFGDVQTRNDLIDQFKQLKSGLHQAIEDRAVTRNQYFWDGGKQSGQLVMNGLLMSNGYLPVSIAARDRLKYNTLMVLFYETGDTHQMESFLSTSIPWPIEKSKTGDSSEKND